MLDFALVRLCRLAGFYVASADFEDASSRAIETAERDTKKLEIELLGRIHEKNRSEIREEVIEQGDSQSKSWSQIVAQEKVKEKADKCKELIEKIRKGFGF
ncbi:MAG: hypothetical protein HY360_12120 [Verrucomicrobia bacterium]|nr:hypothetical protein [Verrucomicrobiota bacterium]